MLQYEADPDDTETQTPPACATLADLVRSEIEPEMKNFRDIAIELHKQQQQAALLTGVSAEQAQSTFVRALSQSEKDKNKDKDSESTRAQEKDKVQAKRPMIKYGSLRRPSSRVGSPFPIPSPTSGSSTTTTDTTSTAQTSTDALATFAQLRITVSAQTTAATSTHANTPSSLIQTSTRAGHVSLPTTPINISPTHTPKSASTDSPKEAGSFLLSLLVLFNSF